MPKVLLVGIGKKEEKRMDAFFKSVGVDCLKVATIDAAIERIPSDPPTLIIAENPDSSGALYSLDSVLKTSAPSTPFLVALPQSSVSKALDAMKAGAYDCLSKPLNRFDVLVSAKRATIANGRTLFSKKLVRPRKNWDVAIFALLFVALIVGGIRSRYNGPPDDVLNLGSATLSGLQWDGRDLWVGNWVDSTVTHYRLRQGFLKKSRTLDTEDIFRMQDSQPILVCRTADTLITIGFDLKMRSHQLGVGLPTLQTFATPGTSPSGLAWDGQFLWSIDSQTGLIYKHGADLRVIETIPSLVPSPTGLAWDGDSLWVLGGAPFVMARLERYGFGHVWRGPFHVTNVLSEMVTPSGLAVGFGRLWLVSGGDPRMSSRSLEEIMSQKNQRWKGKD